MFDWDSVGSGIQGAIDEHGARDVALELRRLGFLPCSDWKTSESGNLTPNDGGDFIARDDRDGPNGSANPYIWKWFSSTPCPISEMLREPIAP